MLEGCPALKKVFARRFRVSTSGVLLGNGLLNSLHWDDSVRLVIEKVVSTVIQVKTACCSRCPNHKPAVVYPRTAK